jgi:hypothetical protein
VSNQASSQPPATAAWTIVSAPKVAQHGPSCLAIYNGRQQVKLHANSLSISFRGRPGTNSYAYRLDENPPVRILFPNPAGQEVGTFILEGSEFEHLRNAKRLRLQAAPVFSSIVVEDIDLSSMLDALAAIRRCAL